MGDGDVGDGGDGDIRNKRKECEGREIIKGQEIRGGGGMCTCFCDHGRIM